MIGTGVRRRWKGGASCDRVAGSGIQAAGMGQGDGWCDRLEGNVAGGPKMGQVGRESGAVTRDVAG